MAYAEGFKSRHATSHLTSEAGAPDRFVGRSTFSMACQTFPRNAEYLAAATISAYDQKLAKWRILLDTNKLNE